jgi:hypothetical protein
MGFLYSLNNLFQKNLSKKLVEAYFSLTFVY